MNTFAEDINKGLSAAQKYTSSKYFYDDEGSCIFQQIMNMPEYYLTNCEFEILENQSAQIVEALEFDGHFNIIELGAGDGLKTFQLLHYLVNQEANFTYIPVDISEEAMNQLQSKLETQLPRLHIRPMVGDYFQILKENIGAEKSQNLLLFLGSNIGNYTLDAAADLLQIFNQSIQAKDKVLIGFDLQKNPNVIRNAYADKGGITRNFNKNLLTRINRELGANFNLDLFDFYSTYNPQNGEVRSYLVSLADQEVGISSIGKQFHFLKDELISTELSRKYTLEEIENMATSCGFRNKQHFQDSRHYFSDSLWEK